MPHMVLVVSEGVLIQVNINISLSQTQYFYLGDAPCITVKRRAGSTGWPPSEL